MYPETRSLVDMRSRFASSIGSKLRFCYFCGRPLNVKLAFSICVLDSGLCSQFWSVLSIRHSVQPEPNRNSKLYSASASVAKPRVSEALRTGVGSIDRCLGVYALVFGTLALRGPVPANSWDSPESSQYFCHIMNGYSILNRHMYFHPRLSVLD